MNDVFEKNSCIFLDEYSLKNRMLLETLQRYASKSTAYVLKDEAFLPMGVMSIYEYFIRKNETKLLEKKEVFYAFVDLPEYWSVRPAGENGAVFDMGKKKADVYFQSPKLKRNVHRIEWLADNGRVFRKDYYNSYGFVYCMEYLDENENVISKGYYTSAHEEVININCSNGIVSLFEQGCLKKIFSSVEIFLKEAVQEIISGNERCFLTSCKQAEWAIEMKQKVKGELRLILQQENEVEEFRMHHYAEELHSPLLIMNNFNTRFCKLDGSGEEYSVCYYPNSLKLEKGQMEALVFTVSDQLYGIEQLVDLFPKINFHIAAPSIVSKALNEFSKKENVYLYPLVSETEVSQLLQRCSLYLDINFGSEVCEAVIRANSNNMLILAQRQTLHMEAYVLEECVFDSVEAMVQTIRRILEDEKVRQDLIMRQQEKVNISASSIMR